MCRKKFPLRLLRKSPLIGLCWFRIRLVTLVEVTEAREEETTEEVAMEDQVVETMEEVLREEALPLLQHQHLPVVLRPQEVLDLEMLEVKADLDREGTDKVVMEEMDKAMEEEVAMEEEAKEVAMVVV